jgi:hypothetical protein
MSSPFPCKGEPTPITKDAFSGVFKLRGLDSNQRPPGYEFQSYFAHLRPPGSLFWPNPAMSSSTEPGERKLLNFNLCLLFPHRCSNIITITGNRQTMVNDLPVEGTTHNRLVAGPTPAGPTDKKTPDYQEFSFSRKVDPPFPLLKSSYFSAGSEVKVIRASTGLFGAWQAHGFNHQVGNGGHTEPGLPETFGTEVSPKHSPCVGFRAGRPLPSAYPFFLESTAPQRCIWSYLSSSPLTKDISTPPPI